MKMNKCVLIMLFVLFIAFSVYAESPKKVKITSLEWPPYSGENLSSNGIAIDQLAKILMKYNTGLYIEFYPWERAIAEAKKSDYDGFFPAWPEEVPSGFVATKPIIMSSVSVIAKATFSFTDLETLFKTKRVALIKEYHYSDEITMLSEKYKHNVVFPPSEQLANRMLQINRFDAIISYFSYIKLYKVILDFIFLNLKTASGKVSFS